MSIPLSHDNIFVLSRLRHEPGWPLPSWLKHRSSRKNRRRVGAYIRMYINTRTHDTTIHTKTSTCSLCMQSRGRLASASFDTASITARCFSGVVRISHAGRRWSSATQSVRAQPPWMRWRRSARRWRLWSLAPCLLAAVLVLGSFRVRHPWGDGGRAAWLI